MRISTTVQRGLLAAIAAFALAGAADAQSKKKSEAAEAAQPSLAGYPLCRGVLWVGSTCRRPDGKTCRVDSDGLGNVVLIDCK